MHRFIAKLATTGIIVGALAAPAMAANSTVVVTPANLQGWALNRDASTSTPYEFTEAKASIGNGSVYVKPIGGTVAKDKFIAEKTLGSLASELNSVAYDFLIAGNGTTASANHFYLNVYTNLPGSSTFYDCRFDYVPTAGSTSAFTTASFTSTSAATAVGDRAEDGFTCPTTWGAMQAGSTIKFIAVNVGDTSLSDAGLAGYLDKAVINSGGNVTTYDFELRNVPTNANQCKNGGFASLTNNNGVVFKNQGQCVQFVNSNRWSNFNIVSVFNTVVQKATSGNANSSSNTVGGSATSGNVSNTNSTTTTVKIKN